MKMYEYEVKKIFQKEGIPIPDEHVVVTSDEAFEFVKNIGKEVVIKSQVHVGGRGKAGGIKFASTADEAKDMAKELLGSKLKGEMIKKLLIYAKQSIKQEFYIGITLDRSRKKSVLIFSPSGGMDIEEVSKKYPERIEKIYFDPILGFQGYHFNCILKFVDPNLANIKQLKKIIYELYKIYEKYDCMIVEINPLALLENDEFVAIDGKLQMDDNAKYRQEELMKYWDEAKEDPIELDAQRAGFTAIKMKGNIAVISNGAGLGMSTIDLLQKYGGEPASLLDCGAANQDRILKAIEILTKDQNAKGILFNIMGGLARCDEIARGIAKSLNDLPKNFPTVCRLQGTNVEEGLNILREKDLNAVDNLEDAIKKIVSDVNEEVK